MTKRATFVALVVVLILVGVVGLLRETLHAFRSSFCTYRPYELETQKSLGGTWIAGRYVTEDRCSDGIIRLALFHPDGAQIGSNDFLLSPISAHVLFKWLDDSHLLIAARSESDVPEKPDHFKDVRLSYTLYPGDPDQSREVKTRLVIERNPDFKLRFEKTDVLGSPGVRCLLHLTADGGKYLEELELILEARKTPATKALKYRDRRYEPGTVPERSDGAVTLAVRQNYEEPARFVTAATFNSFHTAGLDDDRNFKPVETSSSRMAPNWQMVWTLNRFQLKTVLDDVRAGRAKTKLGFWLDNMEIIYTFDAPGDPGALGDFERCLADNALFAGQQ